MDVHAVRYEGPAALEPIVQKQYSACQRFFERKNPSICVLGRFSDPAKNARAEEFFRRVAAEAEIARACGIGTDILKRESGKYLPPHFRLLVTAHQDYAHEHSLPFFRENAAGYELYTDLVLARPDGIIIDYAMGANTIVPHELTHRELGLSLPDQALIATNPDTQRYRKLQAKRHTFNTALVGEAAAYAYTRYPDSVDINMFRDSMAYASASKQHKELGFQLYTLMKGSIEIGHRRKRGMLAVVRELLDRSWQEGTPALDYFAEHKREFYLRFTQFPKREQE